MKFGTNYASLRIPYGVPLKIIQFRFGEYETSDQSEIEILMKHPETFPINEIIDKKPDESLNQPDDVTVGGDEDVTGTSNGNQEPKPNSENGNTRKRRNRSGSGQSDSADGEHRDADGVS